MTFRLVPGTLVRNPAEPDWGIGQIQSVVGNRITVNFEHEGKLLIDGNRVRLVALDEAHDSSENGAGG